MRSILLSIILLATGVSNVRSEGIFDNLSYYVRVGWSIGGAMPIGMPATIRGMSSYSIEPNVVLALDAYKPLKNSWGLMAGFHFDRKGMKVDAEVKNYHMAMRQGSETLEGMFTGNVITDTEEWMLTLPLQVTYDVSPKVRIKLGPYIAYVSSSNFSGYAYDGYLRVDDPTGDKVELGTTEASRGTYDFTDDLRKFNFGFDAGADWYFSNRIGAYVDLSWGLTGIFKKDFDTIEQTLYPIYGTIGLTYKL